MLGSGPLELSSSSRRGSWLNKCPTAWIRLRYVIFSVLVEFQGIMVQYNSSNIIGEPIIPPPHVLPPNANPSPIVIDVMLCGDPGDDVFFTLDFLENKMFLT